MRSSYCEASVQACRSIPLQGAARAPRSRGAGGHGHRHLPPIPHPRPRMGPVHLTVAELARSLDYSARHRARGGRARRRTGARSARGGRSLLRADEVPARPHAGTRARSTSRCCCRSATTWRAGWRTRPRPGVVSGCSTTRHRGAVPARPGPPRHRDLLRPSARGVAGPGRRADDHRAARRREPARRAGRPRDGTVRRDAGRHDHGSRAPPGGARSPTTIGVLPRPARVRADGAARPDRRRSWRRAVPPSSRREHVGEPRRRPAAGGNGGAAARDDRAARRHGARRVLGRIDQAVHAASRRRRPGRGGSVGQPDRAGRSRSARDRRSPVLRRASPPSRSPHRNDPHPGDGTDITVPNQAAAQPCDRASQPRNDPSRSRSGPLTPATGFERWDPALHGRVGGVTDGANV